jgi:hypothetical protein
MLFKNYLRIGSLLWFTFRAFPLAQGQRNITPLCTSFLAYQQQNYFGP